MPFQKGHTINKGKIRTAENRRNIGLAQIGRKASEATKKKMSLAGKNKIFTEEHKNNISKAKMGHTVSEEIRKMLSIARKGKTAWNKGKKCPQISLAQKGRIGIKGELHWKWIEDRTTLKTSKGSEERRSTKYKDWRRKVANRDKWKCRINNGDCDGRVEVHHILGFTGHKELKYEVNNGITLCHFHHPRKRNDEIRMIPVLQDIVLSIAK